MDIQAIIDNSIAEEKAKPRIRSGCFNPSSFGMCYRQQYWNRKDVPKTNPPDARSFRVFKCGNLFEDFVIDLLPIEKQTQVLVEEDDVKGYADLVVGDTVFDIKSQHSKAFWYIKKCKDIITAKYNNWLQVMYYAIRLDKKNAGLIIVSKDDLTIWQHQLPVDSFWREQVAIELAALRYLWKKDEVPPALPRCEITKKQTYWHCSYCSFLRLCQETEEKAGREHPQKK